MNISSTTDADMINSIEVLHLIPRVLVGKLAIIYTFLLYKIAECQYNNRTIALIASILFAVMPITWLLRKIILESLLLPLLLSFNIIRTIYKKRSEKKLQYKEQQKNTHNFTIRHFLGLAVLTKIPIFTMIPIVGYLVYTTSNKNWKVLGLWLIPVISIPLIWPVDAILIGDFNLWLKDAIWHIQRDRVLMILQ